MNGLGEERTLVAQDSAPTQRLKQAFLGCTFTHDDNNGGWFIEFEDGDRYHVTQRLTGTVGGVMYRFSSDGITGPDHADPVMAFQAHITRANFGREAR